MMDVRYIQQRIEEKRRQISQLSIDLIALERELERVKEQAVQEHSGDIRKLLQG